MLCIYSAFIPGGPNSAVFDALRQAFPRTGVLPCACYSYDAGGEGEPHGKRPSGWLASRPADERLVLVGMADRYDAAKNAGRVAESYDFATPPHSGKTDQATLAAIVELINTHGWESRAEAAAILVDTALRDKTF